MKYVLYGLLIYLAYQFIFNFLIPVFNAGRKIRKGFREMHSKMEEQMRQQEGHSSQASPQDSAKPKAGDYIDFEEIK